MKTRCGIFAVILAATAVAQKQPKPLVIEDQGSFFVGGETKALPRPLRLRGLRPGVEAPRSVEATSPLIRCTCSIRSRPMGIGTSPW